MDDVNRYLTEEVVVDYADGHISRREALHRLALLGVGAAVAAPLLAACEADRPADVQTPASSTAPSTAPGTAAAEAITFPGKDGRTLQGAWAAPQSPKGTVLIVHENRGLTDHFKSLPNRFAVSGYAALSVDLLSAEGGTGKFADPAQATAALSAAPAGRFIDDMKSTVDELQKRVPGKKTGAVGFCFGGQQVWSLLNAGEPRLYAAAPFYGPAPTDADFSRSPNAKVLGVYAELDARVNASRELARAALQKAGLTFEIVTYPGVDHAFFNETGQRHNPTVAASAYQKMIEWFDRYLSS
jgi:carboxymethylenebutenolidase